MLSVGLWQAAHDPPFGFNETPRFETTVAVCTEEIEPGEYA
jgi:hypothetical protein